MRISPEQDLIVRFLAGKPDAVRTIDEWIAKAAYSYKNRLAHVWEDVHQSARLEITHLLQTGKFRGESSLKTYLWRVVNNVCLTFIRKETCFETVEIDEASEKIDNKSDSPLETVLQKESETVALRVWSETSEDCRELWQMILQGMSYDEMSKVKDITSGTLRVRVLRCREKAVVVREKFLKTRAVKCD